MLNSKEAIASHCLKTLSTSNSDDKCLQILTLAYISLLIILDNLANFFGWKRNLCTSLRISFLHSVSYAA